MHYNKADIYVLHSSVVLYAHDITKLALACEEKGGWWVVEEMFAGPMNSEKPLVHSTVTPCPLFLGYFTGEFLVFRKWGVGYPPIP